MPQQIVSGVQHQLRRGTNSQILAFTGATGELIYDLTYNRITLQDGVTPGGFAQSMLTYQLVFGTGQSTQVSPNVANVLVTTVNGNVTLVLPPAAQYMPGQMLSIIDNGGNAGTSNITVVTNTSADKIYSTAGVASTSFTHNGTNKRMQLISNSSAKWVGVAIL